MGQVPPLPCCCVGRRKLSLFSSRVKFSLSPVKGMVSDCHVLPCELSFNSRIVSSKRWLPLIQAFDRVTSKLKPYYFLSYRRRRIILNQIGDKAGFLAFKPERNHGQSRRLEPELADENGTVPNPSVKRARKNLARSNSEASSSNTCLKRMSVALP